MATAGVVFYSMVCGWTLQHTRSLTCVSERLQYDRGSVTDQIQRLCHGRRGCSCGSVVDRSGSTAVCIAPVLVRGHAVCVMTSVVCICCLHQLSYVREQCGEPCIAVWQVDKIQEAV